MKWCSRCKTSKPISDFGVNRGRKDGLTVYCIECGREANRVSRLKYRRLALSALGGKCTECGYDKDERALQFDHVHSDGKHDRTSGLGSGAKFYRAIIDGTIDGRVQILCANCNQIKVWEADERTGRQYTRQIPTERIDRPSRRWTPEQRELQSAKAKAMWDDPEKREALVAAQTEAGQDPELRAARSKAASKNMTRRWASGEIPNRRRTE